MLTVRRPLLLGCLLTVLACSSDPAAPGGGAGGTGGSGSPQQDASASGSGGSADRGTGGSGGTSSTGSGGSGGTGTGGTASAGSSGSGGNGGSGGTTSTGGSSGAGATGGQGGQAGSAVRPADAGLRSEAGLVDAAPEAAPVYMNAASPAMKCFAEPQHSGGLTHYDRTPLGNCGEPWPTDDMFAAISTADYGASTVCGQCVEITGPTGIKGIVRVVDQCPIATNPICTRGHIDLSVAAYNRIAPIGRGNVPDNTPVPWRYVPCQVTGPIVYHFKDMSQQYWFAVQIRNSRYGIAKVEYRAPDGTWKPLAPRTVDLAYFVLDMPPAYPIDLRVTDVNGQTIDDVGLRPASNVDVPGHVQFPTCLP